MWVVLELFIGLITASRGGCEEVILVGLSSAGHGGIRDAADPLHVNADENLQTNH